LSIKHTSHATTALPAQIVEKQTVKVLTLNVDTQAASTHLYGAALPLEQFQRAAKFVAQGPQPLQ
jgi:hypothetical protein